MVYTVYEKHVGLVLSNVFFRMIWIGFTNTKIKFEVEKWFNYYYVQVDMCTTKKQSCVFFFFSHYNLTSTIIYFHL
jgi:hypothetical protein